MVQLTLCNELLAGDGLSLSEQCARARALGYMGLELAPGTLGSNPHRMAPAKAAEIRRVVEDHGLVVTGMHYLLFPYPELSVTDPARAGETGDVLRGLMDLCAALGGRLMVHGSPSSRRMPDGGSPESVFDHLVHFLRPLAEHAAAAGLVYAFEPLAREDTSVINTVAEGVALAEAVNEPALRTMLDTLAAGRAEAEPVADILRHWVPTGWLAHVHVNETTRGAPGTGSDPFPEIVGALRDTGWDRPVGMEPFVTVLDATVTAAIGAATIRACWKAAGRA